MPVWFSKGNPFGVVRGRFYRVTERSVPPKHARQGLSEDIGSLLLLLLLKMTHRKILKKRIQKINHTLESVKCPVVRCTICFGRMIQFLFCCCNCSVNFHHHLITRVLRGGEVALAHSVDICCCPAPRSAFHSHHASSQRNETEFISSLCTLKTSSPPFHSFPFALWFLVWFVQQRRFGFLVVGFYIF